MFLVSLDVTIVNIALPEIVDDFGTDRASLSWVLSGFNIAFAAGLLTAGRLADRFVVTGIGVGLTIATIGAASNAFLPPTRFAMGGAVNATVRQVGAALGIAAVVALLGDPTSLGAVSDAFERAYVFIGVSAAAAGVVMWTLYRRPIAAVDEAAVPSDAPLAAPVVGA